jgi:hypothetical protein
MPFLCRVVFPVGFASSSPAFTAGAETDFGGSLIEKYKIFGVREKDPFPVGGYGRYFHRVCRLYGGPLQHRNGFTVSEKGVFDQQL